MSIPCKHEKTHVNHNVGYDIWDGGEETQHIEECKDCGAYRFIVEGYIWKDSEGFDCEYQPFHDEGKWLHDGWFKTQGF